MQTFDVTDPSLDVTESRFLEASAGTGKTFAIEHLFVRMLTEGENPPALSEILAVTFTKEATREMRERIRKRLEEGASPLHKQGLLQFDQAQIFTIHSFCHRMLTEFAFEAGGPLQISGGGDLATHLEEIRAVVAEFFETGDPSYAHEISALAKRARFEMGSLIDQIVREVEQSSSPPPLPKIGSFSSPPLAEIEKDFAQLAARYKLLKREEGEKQLSKLSSFLERRDSNLLLGEKGWFFEKMHEENAKVRAAPLGALPLLHPTFFPLLYKEVVPFLKAARDPKGMLKRVAFACRKRWEEKVARTDISSFGDLLKKMREAVQNPRFREKVREKYKGVIVDEFQDTDPLQWEIFESLFLSEEHTLILVGDPKQSIYGFRSADLYTYLRAKEALGEERASALGTNYRSCPPLVKALNRLFSHSPDWLSLPNRPGSLPFHPVATGRTDTRLPGPHFFVPWIEAEKGRERSWPTKRCEQTLLFPYIASEIGSLSAHLSLSDIAILVKDRFQGERLSRFFARIGIPSEMIRGINLAKTRGFAAVEIALRPLAFPKRSDLKKGATLGPLSSKYSLFSEELRSTFPNTSFGREALQTIDLLLGEGTKDYPHLLEQMERWKGLSTQEEPRLILKKEEGQEKVAILTTFASKGLEFGALFAVGTSSRHTGEEFNANRESEKMRQLYVALTRARERLYLPLFIDRENREVNEGEASPAEGFFAKWGLEAEALKETLTGMGIEIVIPNGHLPSPVQPPSQEFSIEPSPPPFQLPLHVEHVTSFTSLAGSSTPPLFKNPYYAQDLTKKTVHTMPLGAETGKVIHELLEQLLPLPEKLWKPLIEKKIASTHLSGFEEPIVQMIQEVLTRPLSKGFSLSELSVGSFSSEVEFLYRQETTWVKGFADLVFQMEGRYYILDWKTNWLGPSDDSYTEEAMFRSMEENEYFLQARLYKEALERYLKSYTDRPFGELYGGTFYLYLRGRKEVFLV